MIRNIARFLLTSARRLIGILLVITVILVALFIFAMLEYQGAGH